MSALHTLHAALRPAGVLLDIRPTRQHPWVEAWRDATSARLGQIDDSYRHGTLDIADAALQHVVDEGRFMRERATNFTFTYHFDSIGAWLDYMPDHWHSAHLAPELITRAYEALPAGVNGELRILRAIHVARLRRA